ncbi:unnamed protein product [Symbiodinium sp. CCMP2456]|nr:unnamed protein product [Symbiodinium sp. CCMP2456]
MGWPGAGLGLYLPVGSSAPSAATVNAAPRSTEGVKHHASDRGNTAGLQFVPAPPVSPSAAVQDGPVLGVTIYAPHFGPVSFGVVSHVPIDLEELVIHVQRSSMLPAPGLDLIVPITEQRFPCTVELLAFPSFLHQLQPTHYAVMIDLSRVGGHYHAASFPEGLTLQGLLVHVETLMWYRPEDVDVWIGASEFPASRGVLSFAAGSTFTVLCRGVRPPRAYDVRHVLSSPMEWGPFEHAPRPTSALHHAVFCEKRWSRVPFPTLGTCCLEDSVRGALNLSPEAGLLQTRLRLSLDVHGDTCHTVFAAASAVPAWLIDLRPLGFALRILHKTGRPDVEDVLPLVTFARPGDSFPGCPCQIPASVRIACTPEVCEARSDDILPIVGVRFVYSQVGSEEVASRLGFHGQAVAGVAAPPQAQCRSLSSGTPSLSQAAQHHVALDEREHLPAPFHRLAGVPPEAGEFAHTGAQEDSDADSHEQIWSPTFLLLAPDVAPEVVKVTLEAPCSVDDCLQAIVDAADPERYRFFPRHLPVSPQPSQFWGAILTLPAWAGEEPVVVLDLIEIDGRCFATYLPNPFTRSQVLFAARLPPEYDVRVFAFRRYIPMQPRDYIEVEVGGKVTFRRPGTENLVPGFALDNMLYSPHSWDPEPLLPLLSGNGRFSLVREEGYTYFSLVGDEHDVLQCAGAASGLVSGEVHFALGQPRPCDLLCHGLPCQDICAISAMDAVTSATAAPSAQTCLVLVDQRPLLEGWSLWLSSTNEIDHAEMAGLLETFVPAGWQIQRGSGANIEQGMLQVREGLILTAEFVPITSSDEAPASANAPPSPSGDSESGSSGSSNGSHPTFGPANLSAVTSGASERAAASGGRDRSRSRSGALACQHVEFGGCHPCTRCRDLCFGLALFACATPVQSAPVHPPFCPAGVVVVLSTYASWGPLLAFGIGGIASLGQVLARLWSACSTRFVDALGLVALKWLMEPAGRNSAERTHLTALRSLTVELGGTWLPRLPFFFDPPLAVQDDSESPDTFAAGLVRRVPCAVLKLDFTPEHVPVTLRIPATEIELEQELQLYRPTQYKEAFPAVMPVIPQPVSGYAVLIASTAWHGCNGVCFDTSRFDNRLFVVFAPEYATRGLLIRLADLPAGLDPIVRIGVDDFPLPDGVEVGRCALPEVPTLGQELLSPDAWPAEAVFPVPVFAGAAGLLFKHHTHLYIAEPHETMSYYQRVSATTGASLARMRLFAARPAPLDAELGGVPCEAIVAVGEHGVASSNTWHMVILDCRPLEDGWQAIYAEGRYLDVLRLLDDLDRAAPLGWRTCFVGNVPPSGSLPVTPGQVLTFRYFPAPVRNLGYRPPPPQQPIDMGGASASSGGVAGAEGGGSSGVPVHFLVLAPEYEAERIQFLLALPTTVAEVLPEVSRRRDPGCHHRFPRLLPVPIQPPFSFACLIALPAWDPVGIPVVVACLVPPFRIFAALVPAVIRPEAVLRIAGVGPDEGALVFFHDVPWAVPADSDIFVRAGCLLTVSSPNQADPPPVSLDNMLRSEVGWHDNPAWPGPHPEGIWLLTEQQHHRFLCASRRPPLRVAVSTALDIPQSELMFMPATPAIRDHSSQGMVSSQVFFAVRHNDIPA